MTALETYRGFRIHANCEHSIVTGNTPRELYHTHTVECGGVSATLIEKEPVNFVAYSGGMNPVYGESIEKVKERILQRTPGMNDDGSFNTEACEGCGEEFSIGKCRDGLCPSCKYDRREYNDYSRDYYNYYNCYDM